MSELFPGLPVPAPAPEPIAAAAVILWRPGPRGREIFWVKRGALRFAGGFYAFAGGRLDPADARVSVLASPRGELAPFFVCAGRELFEETGVLLARGPSPGREALGAGRRALLAGELGFCDFLAQHRLSVDPEQLLPAGRWITPPRFPLRYDARLFLARLPEGQQAQVWPGELESGEWILASDAVSRWERGDVLLHPPNLWGARCLARSGPPACLDLLRAPPATSDFITHRIEFQRGLFLASLRTPTLPPATHTNAWMVELGGGALALIDPGSPHPEEQEYLETVLAHLATEGLRLTEVWLTHAHQDHTGGLLALRRERDLLLRAHPETALRLPPMAGVGAPLADGDLLHGRYRAVHTPGHARGHVAFLDERTGALIAGDMVSTLSTIVIDPPEGDMAAYVRSLTRLRDLGPRTLFPAHGPPTQGAVEELDRCVAHRREREGNVLDALARPGTLDEVTARAYQDIPAFMLPVAARSCLASLEKLAREGQATTDGMRWYRP